MDKAAAFAATYSDFRLVKGRKVCQFVFEVPLERAEEALAILGGMPNPAAEEWCAIARLKQKPMEVEAQPRPETAPPTTAPSGGAKSAASRAAILCNDQKFRRFLNEEFIDHPDADCLTAEDAALFVRSHCGVQSRRDIKVDQPLWRDLMERYAAWEMAANVVPT